MRKVLMALLIGCSIPILAAAPHTVVLHLQHMTCSLCTVTVRKALEKVPGVLNASVDYTHKTATVQYDPARTTTAALIRATTNAGFPSKPQSGTQ